MSALLALPARAEPSWAETPGWPDNVAAREVLDKAQIADRTGQFEKDFRPLGIDVDVMSGASMVVLPVTISREGNKSYGALCLAQFSRKKLAILVCDDEMVGHFAFVTQLGGLKGADRDSVA